jgi:hypothetical protein
MQTPPGTVLINKIAAAIRQLDAAIRMFFAKEDELAIHTVASAAFRILRDITEKRGKHFTAEVLRHGFYVMARQYAEGKLPKAMLTGIENSELMGVIKYILEEERVQGEKFDISRINVRMSKKGEQGAWPSKAANYLKHADYDPEEHLAVDEVKNQNVLIGACIAYTNLMRTPTPEIMAFFAFWAAKNDADAAGWAEEVQGLQLKLSSVEEPSRHRLYAKFIREASKKSARIHSAP